jgi:hypothetical protein
MTTGASAEPRAGCPSCFPEDSGLSAFCPDESTFFGACRSEEDCEEPPLPAAQPTRTIAASVARMRSVNTPLANLRTSVLVPITSLPSASYSTDSYTVFSALGRKPGSCRLIADRSKLYAARALTDQVHRHAPEDGCYNSPFARGPRAPDVRLQARSFGWISREFS